MSDAESVKQAMCMVLLLGSDIQIPTSKWSEENPRFCVEKLPESCRDWTRLFSKPHVYYLNPPAGCGCGFEMDMKKELKEIKAYQIQWKKCSTKLKKEIGYSWADELKDLKKRKQGCDDLINLIKQLLQQTEELEIYALSREPEPDEKPTVFKTITPDDILVKGRFNLFPGNDHERIFYKVIDRI
ncbi:MAG: hypothetical protein JW774_00085 [Candidatus Aureabacteria bacterium]|nr:hypothetical protein [Candidatus Auribacterota bacterium]